MVERREQLLEIMEDAARGETKATLRDRIAELEAKNERLRKALDALDRMSRGLDWCDKYEQARRWSAARRALAGGADHD